MTPSNAPNETPGPYHVRLVPDRFMVTWIAALFGLCLGVTMTYIPYEFQTRAFEVLYPRIRLVGLGFLVGSILIGLVALYPRRLPQLDTLGRVILLLMLGIYWYAAAYIPGSRTGLILYPLMIACVFLEAFPRLRQRGLFPLFLGLVSISFGLIMVLAPNQFSSVTYTHLQPVILPVGLFYLVGGLGVLFAPWRQRDTLRRLLFGGLALPFTYLAYALAVSRSWAGMELYAVITLGCIVAAWAPWVVPPASVRWRLLRGFVVAGLLPLLVVGGVASYLSQRAIEQETRANAERTISAEADRLAQYIQDARHSLQTLASLPGMATAVNTRNDRTVRAFLTNIQRYRPDFNTLGVIDPTGTAWTVIGGSAHGTIENFADREWYQGGINTTSGYISKPFFNVDNQPLVVIVVPIRDEGRLVGLLSGSILLDELSGVATSGSQGFPIQVVDRRDGVIVRGTTSQLVQPLAIPNAGRVLDAETAGIEEISDGTRRYLTVFAPVEGTEWVVLVTQPISVLFARITQLSAMVIAIVLIASVLALLLTQIVAREVTDRLSDVQAAAGALAAGNLAQRVTVNGMDELADLGRAFNEMADQIQVGQTELARVNTKLQDAVRVRDDFISVASHEMKTPLTPLKGFSQTLIRQLERTDRPFDRQQAIKALGMMSRQVDRLTELVNDLLDTTRIRGGRFVLAPTRMDLVTLSREIVERFSSQSDAERHTLRLLAPSGAVTGEWDGRRLDQVLTNLISNALRYSPAGSEIWIEISRDQNSALMSVKDQGIGIPPEGLAELFQPFFRAANATSHYGGLGLGLYISHEIVQRHGGQIWAESAGPGQGSQFFVRLPLNGASIIDTPVPDSLPG